MINTVADAQALVAATKYPPVGGRSWGPALAMELWDAANKATIWPPAMNWCSPSR
jgi:2-keto-3-deoxy-L-rhamnonate aldolase RhmA